MTLLLPAVCPFKTCPCVRSERPRVYRHHARMCYHMCAWCRYTRGRFERTHRHVLRGCTGFHGATPHTPQHNTTRRPPHGDREKQRQREKRRRQKRQEKRRQNKTRQDKNAREDQRREIRRQEKREERRGKMKEKRRDKMKQREKMKEKMKKDRDETR